MDMKKWAPIISLISVAVIYFLLTFLVTRIARRMDRIFTAKHDNHRIKGVDK